jgi:hypothetical protein
LKSQRPLAQKEALKVLKEKKCRGRYFGCNDAGNRRIEALVEIKNKFPLAEVIMLSGQATSIYFS